MSCRATRRLLLHGAMLPAQPAVDRASELAVLASAAEAVESGAFAASHPFNPGSASEDDADGVGVPWMRTMLRTGDAVLHGLREGPGTGRVGRGAGRGDAAMNDPHEWDGWE